MTGYENTFFTSWFGRAEVDGTVGLPAAVQVLKKVDAFSLEPSTRSLISMKCLTAPDRGHWSRDRSNFCQLLD
jgi:hypothetical protein